MKNKIKTIILTIICILTMPILVNADMGAPESYQYEVIVSNPQGAKVYDWEGKATGKVIPFDTKITVGYEYLINGELYVDMYLDDEESSNITLDGVIKSSDTKLFTEEIDFSKLSKNEDKTQYYAFLDTEMYKGPSTVYGKIENTTIPAGTTINFTYSSGGVEFGGGYWIYTEYKETKGWVFTYAMKDMSPYTIDCTVALVEKGKIMIIGDQDIIDHKGNVVGKAKDLEEYEYSYIRQTYPKTSEYYIKNDKIEGWVSGTFFGPSTEGAVHYNLGTYLAVEKDSIELYEDYRQTKKVKNLTIPYGTEYEEYYCVGVKINEQDDFDEENIIQSCQVSYNGKKYWMDAEIESLYYSSDITITTKEELSMYKYMDNTESLNITIPVNKTLVTKWSYLENYEPRITWYYIEYEGTKGWIKIDESISETEVEEEVISPEEEEEEIVEEPTVENEEKSLTPKQTAFIAIGVAVLLGVGALVTILLINKNKKTKKEEAVTEKEEVKEEKIETENVPNEEEKEVKDKE